jgi:hypothetical protein
VVGEHQSVHVTPNGDFDMSRSLSRLAAIFLLVLTRCVVASAQTESTPVLRSDVKAETRSAQKAGRLAPTGEGPQFAVPRTSEKTRTQRKAETIAARKAGLLVAAGQGDGQRADRENRSRPTTVDRAARKAETRAAEKARTLTPAGEGISPR